MTRRVIGLADEPISGFEAIDAIVDAAAGINSMMLFVPSIDPRPAIRMRELTMFL